MTETATVTMEPTELRTARLLLRPFALTDAANVLAYANDEAWARFVPVVPYPYTRRDAEEYVARCVLATWSDEATFALVLEGVVVGSISLHLDVANNVSGLGYGIARAHWGRGLATEAAKAVIDYGFEAFDLAKLHASADARNVASWRVMEKLGMQREGLLRAHRVDRDGKRIDEVRYGLLREEWERARR